jgi:hypothetical protein
MNRTHRGTTGPPGTQRARFPGGDRALATTSGRHHGQAIRIDSFEVDDCLILGPPPGSVKARRRILATPGRCTHRNVVRGSRGKWPLSRTASAITCRAPLRGRQHVDVDADTAAGTLGSQSAVEREAQVDVGGGVAAANAPALQRGLEDYHRDVGRFDRDLAEPLG